MLEAAFKFRKAELWNTLTDSDIFAVKFTDGKIGYMCVMGNGGEHFALGLYIGTEGLRTYYDSISPDSLASMQELMELSLHFDCINCDFMQAKKLDSEVKKKIRAYAEAHGLKIPRQHGWPDFTRHTPLHEPFCITDEEDARRITEALNAALEVAEKLHGTDKSEAGFDEVYASRKGGKNIPLLTKTEEGYEWTTITLPPYKKRELVEYVFDNPVQAANVRALPSKGELWMRAACMPVAVPVKEDRPGFFPKFLIASVQPKGMFFPVFPDNDSEYNDAFLLSSFANQMKEVLRVRPQLIVTDREETYALLKDFCRKCDIELRMSDHPLDDLDRLFGMMLQMGDLVFY